MTTANFVLCACPKKAEHFCKNWDGKGNVPAKTEELRAGCQANPDDCKFLVEPKNREGCDWLYQTIASASPSSIGDDMARRTAEFNARTTIAIPEKEPEPKTEPQKPPKKLIKKQSLTCTECGEDATHKIEGYKPTYLCIEHAETAQANGFKLIELKEETNNA